MATRRARTSTAEGTQPVGRPPTSTSPRVSLPLTRGQIIWLVCIGVALVAVTYALRPILWPFIVAAIVAYISTPAVAWGQRHRLSRTAGTVIVMLFVFMLFGALLLVLAPMLRKEVISLFDALPAVTQYINQSILPRLSRWSDVQIQLDASSIRDAIAANMVSAQDITAKLLASAKTGGLALAAFLANILLLPIVLFYLLRDWDVLLAQIGDLVPRAWNAQVHEFAAEIDAVLSQFLRGQLSVMVFLAAYYSIGLTVVGLDYALPVGLITGLLVFIPYVGFGLGFTFATCAALLQFSSWHGVLYVFAVYGVGQLLESFILVPHLVGRRIGLHPLTVIFALLAFGELFGFVGVLLALPTCAALVVAFRRIRTIYLASPFYRRI